MNRPEITYNDHMVTVTSAQSNEVAKQMTWIAKGVAGIAHQSSLAKGKIHNLVEATDFYAETNTNLDDNMAASIGFDYDQEVNNWLQTNVAGNDYDQAYFFDINIDACPGKVSIRIPEADIVDQTKLHVVTPENVFDDVQTTMGYYITSTGGLDSLVITEDNMDSVYLWIVGVDNDCTQSIDSCGDGILGNTEDCETCPQDCSTPYPDFDDKKPAFKLTLKEFKTFTDKKNGSGHPLDQYQEDYLQGKYEIYLSYGVYETIDGVTFDGAWDEIFWFTDPLTGKPTPTATKKAEEIGNYKAWGGNAKIRRKNLANGKVNRGTHYVDVVNMLMADTIQPHKDNFFFCIYEKDKNAGLYLRNDIAIWSNSWSYSYEGGQNAAIPPAALPSGWDGTDNWRIVSFTLDANGDPGFPFIAAGPNEWLYFANLGTEAEAVFKLERIN